MRILTVFISIFVSSLALANEVQINVASCVGHDGEISRTFLSAKGLKVLQKGQTILIVGREVIARQCENVAPFEGKANCFFEANTNSELDVSSGFSYLLCDIGSSIVPLDSFLPQTSSPE